MVPLGAEKALFRLDLVPVWWGTGDFRSETPFLHSTDPIANVGNMAHHDDFIHSEAFLQQLMRRQLRLSISCALTFGGVLFALPLLNYFAPELMATRVGGFTLTWLILGILFFPFVWIISFTFIRRSLAMERQEADEALKQSRNSEIQ